MGTYAEVMALVAMPLPYCRIARVGPGPGTRRC